MTAPVAAPAVPSGTAPDPRARARREWRRLGDRLATITPQALGRAALTAGVVVAILGATVASWPALLPFLFGALIAYVALPLVDVLDRVMPRALAAAIAIVAVIGAIVAFFVIVVPPLAAGLINLARAFPAGSELQRAVNSLVDRLPSDAQGVLGPVLVAAGARIRDVMDGTGGSLGGIVDAVVQAAVGAAGAAFGLIVLPAWMVTVMAHQRRARTAVDARLAGWLRPDFWAIVRMADRAAGVYLRGFVVTAFVVGFLTFLGLTLVTRAGGPVFAQALPIAVWAGASQLIPELGLIIGFVPAVLVVVVAPDRAGVYVLVYLAAKIIDSNLLGGRRVEDRLGVHPAILIPGVVALSQLGLVWLLLSAPIIAFGSDLIRYLHGRFSEPARPAGLLPGEVAPAALAATVRVPSVYRGRPVVRTSVTAMGATGATGTTGATATPPTPAAPAPAPTPTPTAPTLAAPTPTTTTTTATPTS